MDKLKPKDAICSYCTQCLGLKQFKFEAINGCQGAKLPDGPCPFYPFRLGRRAPIKVIREFCLDCMCHDLKSVRECPAKNCECYPYRLGKNPALKGKRTASNR